MNIAIDVRRGDKALDLDLISAIANYGGVLSE